MESFSSLKSGSHRAEGRRSLAGFTLVELLTVIAVIAILAAILIPVSGAVNKAIKFSVNIGNLRQWATANTLHMQDNKGYIPWRGPALQGGVGIVDSVEPYSNTIRVLPWWNALPPYIGQMTLAQLKARNALPKLGESSIWVSPLAQNIVAGNEWAAFTCYAPPRSSLQGSFIGNIKSIAEPARTVMFGETPHFTEALREGTPYPFINEITSPNSIGPYNRNGSSKDRGGLTGKAALAFFDGSVRTYTGAQISAHGGESAERGNNPERIVWRLDP